MKILEDKWMNYFPNVLGMRNNETLCSKFFENKQSISFSLLNNVKLKRLILFDENWMMKMDQKEIDSKIFI